jgi:acyl-CoA thioesterase-1
MLLIVGDSLSVPFGVAAELGWPALLARRLRAARVDWEVVNASRVGAATRDALAALPPLLEGASPALVIVQLGGNDGLARRPLGEVKEALRELVARCNQAGARVVLVGLLLPETGDRRYERGFSRIYFELARETGASLVPFLLRDLPREALQADGIHPTAAAQPLLLENVWGVVRTLLAAAGARPVPAQEQRT